MIAPIDKALGEGNCMRVTECGKEAGCQSCEATDRNVIQGRSGQASGPNITKPYPDNQIGKWRACAAKDHVLIRGERIRDSIED